MTPNAQTKHSTQCYLNNKAHITHKKTERKIKLSLYQAVEAYRVVRYRGSYIIQTICSQMVVR
jgi:hypothetical protein